MIRIKNLSISQKIIAIVMLISFGVLLSLTIVYSYFSWQANRQSFADSLSVLGKTIGVNASATLAFKDPVTAKEILAALQSNSDIASAQIFDENGEIFTTFQSTSPANQALLTVMPTDRMEQARTSDTTTTVFHPNYIDVIQPILIGNRPTGYISVQGNISALYEGFRKQLAFMGILLVSASIISYLLARRLQAFISGPISELANSMQSVSDENDYALRLTPRSNDELGSLFNSFNLMLEHIQNRDEAIEEAKNIAETANRSKSEFLANMSHEIRTPMNGVLGMAELLENTELNDTQINYVQTIRRSGKTLVSVINDILDFSKVEAGQLTLEEQPFELSPLIEHVLELFKEPVNKKKLELVGHIIEPVPSHLLGDGMRLTQILINLIGNAVKFTHQGKITLTVSLKNESSQQAWLCFSVNDTGIGIAQDKLGTIFEAFRQADGSTSRQYGGTGLGLAISSQLIGLFGGDLQVESKPGLGSTFSFTIPFGKTNVMQLNRPSLELSKPVKETGLAHKTPSALSYAAFTNFNGKILVAEDNPVNQMLACDMLEQMGIETDVANNGREAFEAATTYRYGLILMDIQMPQVDGLEATALIRAHESKLAYNTPIAALTANAMTGDKGHFLNSGMDDYLSKPFHMKDLSALISRWIKPEVSSSEAVEKTNAVGTTDASADDIKTIVLDPATLKSLTDHYRGDKWPRFEKLLAMYTKSADQLMASLQQAVENADAEAIYQAAHSLKSSSANLAAIQVAKTCGQLEAEARAKNLTFANEHFETLKSDYKNACDALNKIDHSTETNL